MPPFPPSRKSANKANPSRRNKKHGGTGRTHNNNQKASKGLVRIIGGKHRARRLPVLVHEGLRPTGDRIKETFFNWLMSHTQNANCLDMYAGSGGLGIEALSRGASQVCFVEQDPKVAAQIVNNIATLKETERATVIQNGALQANIKDFAPFDIVFIDPPFGQGLIAKSLQHLQTEQCLSSDSIVYIEAGHDDAYTVPSDFKLLKEVKTGQVIARLFQLTSVVK